MNFHPDLATAVAQGRKRGTRRRVSANPRSPYHPGRIGLMIGKRIAVCPGRGKPSICRVRVQAVERFEFDPAKIQPSEARLEGFKDVDAFLEVWESMHGRDVVDVWRISLGYPFPVDQVRA